MMSRRWTKEEDEYLAENWGTFSIDTIANELNRTVVAVRSRASRYLKLGPAYQAGGYIPLKDLLGAFGKKQSSNETNFEKHGLKVRKLKLVSSYRKVVLLDDFWKWTEQNRHFMDLSMLEPLTLGKEPAWVAEQRKKDAKSKCRRRPRRWTEWEDQEMISMLKHGCSYTEISDRINRSQSAIWSRMNKLGKGYMAPPDTRGKGTWTDEEKETLRQSILDGDTFFEIGKKVHRNEKAIASYLFVIYGTSKADVIRKQLLKERKKNA